MSNMSLRSSLDNPLQLSSRVGPKPQTTGTQAPLQQQSIEKSVYDKPGYIAKGKLSETSARLLDTSASLSDSQVGTMSNMIDSTQPQLIRKRSSQLPKPTSMTIGLNRSTSGIQLPPLPPTPGNVTTVTTSTTTMPSTTTSTTAPTPPKAFQASDLNLKDRDLTLARFAYSQAESQFNRNKDKLIRTALHDELQPLLKELSKADKGLGGISQKDKDAILARAQQKAYDIVVATGTRDELGMAFSRTKPEELKLLVAKLVIDIRDDKAEGFTQLSSKKQDFVDAVLAGLDQARKDTNKGDVSRPKFTKPPCMMALAEDGIQPAIHKMLDRAGLSKGQLAGIQIKTSSEKAVLLKPFIGPGGDRLKSLAVNALGSYHPPLQARTTQTYVTELGPDDLGTGVKQALANLSQTPDALHLAGVRQALDTHIKSLDAEHNTIWQLGVMSDTQLKGLLQKAAGGNAQNPSPLSPPNDDQLVQEIRQLLPNHTGTTMTRLKGIEVPETIQVGAKSYEAQEHVFTSGFGSIFTYVNKSDPSGQDKVAVKVLTPSQDKAPEKLHAETVHELNLHRELQGPNGHGNVIGLKGAVLDANKNMCIVMEHAGGGGLDKLAEQIHTELKANRISKESAQLLGLALLKQSLESVQYMHEDRQMLHSDIKTANMMLGSDGQVKMIDFGTSHVGPERFIEKRIVDQPRFLAPEQATVTQDGVGSLATSKSDMWSVGTMAYSLLVGNQEEHPFFHKNNMTIDVELAITGHLNKPNSRVMDQVPGWDKTKPSNKPIQDLVDGLMMPMPEQRLSARDALQSPLFQDPRLSSDAMKQIMKNLTLPTVTGKSEEEVSEERFNTVRLALETLAS